MLIPIKITKTAEHKLKEAFVKQAMIELSYLKRSDAEAIFDKIHKNRAVWPDFREQPVSKLSMSALAQKALDGVAEMKRILGGH